MKLHHVLLAVFTHVLSVQAESTSRISNPNTPPVTIKGNGFFVNDKRFYIRGVDYQPGSEFKPKDPIAKTKDCKPDIEKFRKLGINTVRIYSIDNSNPTSHDECMKLLADAGIYVALDVNTANFSLNNFYEEAIHPSYNDQYLQSVFATVEAFAKYDNTLLFFSGNEVVFFANKTFAAPYVKAVTRDIKQYLKTRGLRQVPVGYAGKDIPENRVQMAEYMNCGTGDVRADFQGFNDYSWCSPSSLVNSDWSNKASMFTKYGIPAFFSEYGCKETARTFEEVEALYSPSMTHVFSGGLVYEYSEERKYGLVNISDSGITEMEGFGLLQRAFKKTPSPTDDGGYNSRGGPSECPQRSDAWNISRHSLPVIPKAAAAYIKDGAGPGPYYIGNKGSQWSGNPSTEWAEFSMPKIEDHSEGGTITIPSRDSKQKSTGTPSAAASPYLTMVASILGLSVIWL